MNFQYGFKDFLTDESWYGFKYHVSSYILRYILNILFSSVLSTLSTYTFLLKYLLRRDTDPELFVHPQDIHLDFVSGKIHCPRTPP